MTRLIPLWLGLWACVALVGPAHASDAVLFRLFLTDGTEVVSYGEFARFDDTVVLAVPAGGTPDAPRLHMATLSAALVDWERTNRYAASVRYQRYAATRGEEDFERLSDQVAGVLGEIALTTDRSRALALAEQARQTLAEWPIANYGYRHRDVREIVMVLDDAINTLRGQPGGARFDLSFVATPPPIELEPVRGMPPLAGQLDQMLRLAALSTRAADRVALLHSALAVVVEHPAALALDGVDTRAVRRSIERQLRDEADVDARYQRLADRLMRDATRAAASARVADVERLLERLPREDARLGERRPEIVQALQGSMQATLDSARELRLLRDQWQVRRTLYRDYQRLVAGQMLTLVKAEPRLDEIRRLDGPAPDVLLTLRAQLDGGAERLERLLVAPDLQPTHDLLVGAWRLAQNAVNVRYTAAASADVNAAWAASSAAAGAQMLLGRVQQDLAALSEMPTLRDVMR